MLKILTHFQNQVSQKMIAHLNNRRWHVGHTFGRHLTVDLPNYK